MNVTTLIAPAAAALGLAEAKEYLRIAYEGEDAVVAGLIAAARSRVEEAARVAMISRTLRVTMDSWPPGAMAARVFRLPVQPAQELLAVRVFDASAVAEVVTGLFTPAPGQAARLVWTSGAFAKPGARANGIEIDYVAGFGDEAADVAEGLQLAVKRLVAHAYHARDAAPIGRPLLEDVAGLISPWRRVSL